MIAQPSAGALRVVIADDESETLDLLTAVLRGLGYDVVGAARDGIDAVAQVLALAPDVVVLDIHMPNGSGIDAANRIASELPACAIVLLSGDRALTLDNAQVEATRAFAMLCKPVPSGMLDATLRMAVQRARDLRAARQEAVGAKSELEARKLIERAKGILMRRTGTSEQEAYRIMQRSSQDKSMPMVKIAEAVLASEPGVAPPRPTTGNHASN